MHALAALNPQYNTWGNEEGPSFGCQM